MSLRQAKFDDHWRHIFYKDFPTRFVSIGVTDLQCIANGPVDLPGGITAIVGGNGVGKSTLVAAIAELLFADPNDIGAVYRTRLEGSTTTGIAFNSDHEILLEIHNDASAGRKHTADTFTGEFRWLDPSSLAAQCLAAIETDSNFGDLLEPLTPLKLDTEELKIASYLVGKNYADISIFEIADYGGFDRFPYFRVTAAEIGYSTEGMGDGELSLMLTLWTLKDLPRNSILILDEPETHVSPKSQEALMNIIAKFCDEKAIWVVITTHSPTIIRRIKRENVLLLARNEGKAVIVPSATKLDIALLLGGGVSQQCVILVEDEAAKSFLITLLQQVEPDLYRQCEIVVAGSKDKITVILKNMPKTRSWLTLVGVYDGDIQDQIKSEGDNWPHVFLPGTTAPEELLMALAENSETLAEKLSRELNVPIERIKMALDHATGVDPHEYLRRIADSLAIDLEQCRRAFTLVWLSQNQEPASTLAGDIRKAIEK